jgi:hypothetical protein
MARSLTLTGTVTHIDLSGGFWGIIGSEGQRFRPVEGLPAEFQQEGMQVKVKAKPASGISIFMWGQEIHLLDIQPL